LVLWGGRKEKGTLATNRREKNYILTFGPGKPFPGGRKKKGKGSLITFGGAFLNKKGGKGMGKVEKKRKFSFRRE